MDSLIVLLATSMFVATNIDGLVMLMALHALAPERRRQIVLGQCLGTAALILLSLIVASAGMTALSASRLRWIGLVPIMLGLWALIRAAWHASSTTEGLAGKTIGILGTATLTIASGGDNLAAYVHVLQRLARHDWPCLIAVWFVDSLAWCALAAALGGSGHVRLALARGGRVLVPA